MAAFFCGRRVRIKLALQIMVFALTWKTWTLDREALEILWNTWKRHPIKLSPVSIADFSHRRKMDAERALSLAALLMAAGTVCLGVQRVKVRCSSVFTRLSSTVFRAAEHFARRSIAL